MQTIDQYYYCMLGRHSGLYGRMKSKNMYKFIKFETQYLLNDAIVVKKNEFTELIIFHYFEIKD